VNNKNGYSAHALRDKYEPPMLTDFNNYFTSTLRGKFSIMIIKYLTTP